ncbi:MAG: response regulator [Opitutae bacterium]|nr:response regulator [Opitutae bacterium]
MTIRPAVRLFFLCLVFLVLLAVLVGAARMLEARYGVTIWLWAAGVGVALMAAWGWQLRTWMQTQRATMLAESAGQWRQALGHAGLTLWEWDLPTGRFNTDPYWAETNAATDAKATLENQWRKRVHSDDLGRYLWAREQHLKGRAPGFDVEYRLRCGEADWRWVRECGVVVERDAAGEPRRLAGTHQDLTARKQAEAMWHRQAHMLDEATDFHALIDLQGNVLYANRALSRLKAGGASTTVRHIAEYLSADAAQQLLREAIPAALTGTPWTGDSALLDAQGRALPVSLALVGQRALEGAPAAIAFSAREIGARQVAELARIDGERRRLQKRKFESLSVFAGGIAHDFNNLLTAVMGYTSLARLEVPENSPVQNYFKHTEIATQRAAELCQLMHAYSGRSKAVGGGSDLNALIEEMLPEFNSWLGGKGKLACAFTPGLPQARIENEKARQLLRALVRNAVEALSSRPGGTIQLRTARQAVGTEGSREPHQLTELAAGDYLLLEVADTAGGMTPEQQARVFEPFFTTKVGRHGLGLVAALGIVRSFGGAIRCASEPERGSTFTVLLPLAAERVPASQPMPVRAISERSAGKILVVDDEEEVRAVATRILESIGFAVLIAGDGREGLRLFGEQGDSLDAILLDVSLPQMSGEEVYRELRRRSATVPVVLMSGFSVQELAERFRGEDIAGVLRKPFERESVQRCLLEALRPRA